MANDHITTPLHELSFPVRVSAACNVNSLDSDFIMAWLLQKAEMAGEKDRANRNHFLTAASELAQVYGYTGMAARVRKTLAAVP